MIGQHDRHREPDRLGERVVGEVRVGGEETVPTMVSRPVMTMLAISQNPERVSNILRSSTWTTRLSGTGAGAVVRAGSRTVGEAVAVMPLSFLVGCRR